MQRIHEKYIDNVVVLTVHTGPTGEEDIRKAMTEKGYTFKVILDSSYRVREAYEVESIPTIVVIDKQGIIQAKYKYRPEIEEILISEIQKHR